MTREEMARRLDDLGVHVADVAAAELRKSCATCESYRSQSLSRRDWSRMCIELGIVSYDDDDKRLPTDGSGFCHRHEPKEPR
jgi:hypothetical protein